MVRLRGDLVVATAGTVHRHVRTLLKRRDLCEVVIDFSEAGRVDSSGLAVVSLVRRRLERQGKKLDLIGLHDAHRVALDLMRTPPLPVTELVEPPGPLERVGERVLAVTTSVRDLGQLLAQTVRQGAAVAARKKRLPAGALGTQIAIMGVDAVFIVGLLSFLLGMTVAFQAQVQLQRFGAGVYVADLIGVSMVRELAPLITAVILSGRTGAAIAAELGTMKVNAEIDAMRTMGINPVRFLIVPRMAGITVIGPALTLMAIFIGVLGGMLVSSGLDLPPVTFWNRIVERVTIGDFVHGLGKSVVFAWIIGLAGCHLGMRARGDASSVGAATTRTVVASVFFIIIVDAIFATASTLMEYS